MKEQEQILPRKITVEMEVDTSQIDKAIEKVKELAELLEKVNKLKNTIFSEEKATSSLVEPVAKDVINKITKHLEEVAIRF